MTRTRKTRWRSRSLSRKCLELSNSNSSRGAGARPMDKTWVISVCRQCKAAGVLFFFKQWGGVRKSEAGRTLVRRKDDYMPERPSVPSPSLRERNKLIREVESWYPDEAHCPRLQIA